MADRPVRRDQSFGLRLRKAMKDAAVRPAQLARAVNVGPGSVTRWRNGELPSDLRLPSIAALLRVRLDWLKSGQGSQHAERAASPEGSAREELARAYGQAMGEMSQAVSEGRSVDPEVAMIHLNRVYEAAKKLKPPNTGELGAGGI